MPRSDEGTQEFSVCQFFVDDTYEYVKRLVGAEEAVKTARHYTDNVAVKMGITKRVIITDGGDNIVFQWKAGEGVTYPTPEMRQAERDSKAGK